VEVASRVQGFKVVVDKENGEFSGQPGLQTGRSSRQGLLAGERGGQLSRCRIPGTIRNIDSGYTLVEP